MLLVLSAEVLTRAVTRPKEPSPVAGWSFLRPPEDGTLRGPGPLRLDLPPGARHALLVFVRSDAKVFDQYRVEIHDASGRLSWNAEGLQRAPDGSVPVLVPVERLHRDPFELRLSGLRGGRWQTLALYSAEISG